jgi:hypothetical protein
VRIVARDVVIDDAGDELAGGFGVVVYYARVQLERARITNVHRAGIAIHAERELVAEDLIIEHVQSSRGPFFGAAVWSSDGASISIERARFRDVGAPGMMLVRAQRVSLTDLELTDANVEPDSSAPAGILVTAEEAILRRVSMSHVPKSGIYVLDGGELDAEDLIVRDVFAATSSMTFEGAALAVAGDTSVEVRRVHLENIYGGAIRTFGNPTIVIEDFTAIDTIAGITLAAGRVEGSRVFISRAIDHAVRCNGRSVLAPYSTELSLDDVVITEPGFANSERSPVIEVGSETDLSLNNFEVFTGDRIVSIVIDVDGNLHLSNGTVHDTIASASFTPAEPIVLLRAIEKVRFEGK